MGTNSSFWENTLILHKHKQALTARQVILMRAPQFQQVTAFSNVIFLIRINFYKVALRFANLYAIHIHMSESMNIISQIYYSLGQYLSTSGQRNFRGSRNFEHPGIFLKKNIHHTNTILFCIIGWVPNLRDQNSMLLRDPQMKNRHFWYWLHMQAICVGRLWDCNEFKRL